MGTSPSIYSIPEKQIRKNYKHVTQYLTAKQVERLFVAGETAYDLGVPLNRFFTIHFDDYADRRSPQSFVVGMMEHARKWLQRRGIGVAYLYVLENAPVKGIHAHIMMHIPNGFQVEFKKAMRGWLPFEWSKERVDVKKIDYPPYGDLHSLNPLYGRLRYICKGVNPKEVVRGVEARWQGEITGRRYGVSRLLRR